jgi:hypothetical protein
VNWRRWLLAAIAAIATAAFTALKALLQQELEHSCRPFADWILRRSVRLLPPEHQDRYLAEWLAELDMLGERKLTAIWNAATIRVSASQLRRELLGTSSAYPRSEAWYSVAVSSTGLLIGIGLAVTDGIRAADTINGWALLLCGLSVLYELRTIKILDRVGNIDHGGGSLFDYALLLGWSAGISVPLIIVASLVSHMIRHWHDRPALGKALFNAGQIALAGSAAAWALQDLGAAQPLDSNQPIAIMGGMIVYSMTNTMLMRIAVALDRSSANLKALWSGWQLDVAEWTLLAGLASASIFAIHSLPGTGLVLLLTILYSITMGRMNDLIRPHIHLPQ